MRPFLLILVHLLASIPVPGEVTDPRQPPSPAEREELLGRKEALALRPAGKEGASLSPTAPIDVEKYEIFLEVFPQSESVAGTVVIDARSLSAGLGKIDLDLRSELAVSQVRRGPIPLAFTHASHLLQITLDRPFSDGELIESLRITYSGTPPVLGFGSFSFDTHNGQPIISTLSEPNGAPSWWPCVDEPGDKALVDMDLTVPSTLTGVSNGTLAATIINPNNTTTWQWRSSYPISSYLVSIAVSNYATWTDFYTPVSGGLPDMPVQHWVYPEHLSAAQQDLGQTVPMLEFFANLFGEYPFVDEKYGHAIFPFPGGMEHQTVSSYGSGLIRGDNHYDWVVVHELVHQWWGDAVSPEDWPEIWLNEGFASYGEALWWENLYGFAGYKSYMETLDTRPFCGRVHDPQCGLFGRTVYNKGGWVLHMLRGVVGDAPFFQGLRDYYAQHNLATATTPAFQTVMETASGEDLTSFFARWVYEEEEPDYEWGWTAAVTPGGWVPWVHIDQVQGGALFEMPIRLRVTTPSGTYESIVENTILSQDFALPPVPEPPTLVELDPDDWILKKSTIVTLADGDEDGVPDTADNCAASPNASQADLDNDAIGDPCDPDLDGDGLANGSDCAPFDPLNTPAMDEVTGLVVTGSAVAGLQWDSDLLEGAGVFYDLLGGPAGSLRVDGGIDAAGCLQNGLALPEATDAQSPAPGEGVYFLIRTSNGCGNGPLGFDSSAAVRVSSACL